MGVSQVVGVSCLTPPRPQEVGEEPAGTLQKTPIILAKPPAERVSLGGRGHNLWGACPYPKGACPSPHLLWPRPMTSFPFFRTATATSGRTQGGASTSPAPSRPGPAHRADESAGGGGAGRGRGLGGHGGGACTSPGPGEGGATPHPARLSTAQPGLGPARRAGP